MLEELVPILDEFREKLYFLKRVATFSETYLKAYALADAYNRMLDFADGGMRGHPEVMRAPNLRLILLEHFYTHADKHIDLASGRIFNPVLLGSPLSIGEWQEAGHYSHRSAGNYRFRLNYWKAIYDHRAYGVFVRDPISGNLFSGKGDKPARRFVPLALDRQKLPRIPKITYEEVIQKRNQRYAATDTRVPWWSLFNYGSGYLGRQAYPSYPGMFFIEKAEQQLPQIMSQYARYVDEVLWFAYEEDYYPGKSEQTTIEMWAKARLPKRETYIPLDELARILSFGVPF